MPVTIESVTAFFGWCAVINSVALSIFTLAMFIGRNWIASVHTRIFPITESQANAEYFSFLANYKLFTMVFSIVPYIALKLIH